MSVIPLTLDGPERTVVESLEAFDRKKRAACIQNLERAQLTAERESNVSYDLRVGNEYRDHRDAGKKDLPQGGAITLYPGTAVIIETEEKVYLPRCMFGYIVPKVSLLQLGLSNTTSKIDPGYAGRLLVTVFNLGKRTITLSRGQRFCSVTFLQVLDGAKCYDKEDKRIVGKGSRSSWEYVRDWLERNQAAISAGLIVVTILLLLRQLVSL